MLTDNVNCKDIRVLLVDDEPVIHKSVGDFLERTGYQVTHATEGSEALRLFDQDGADIVLTDIKMPGLDGIELLAQLVHRSRDLEVILITGHGEMDLAVEALRRGAFDFFRKPVKLGELLACLERTRRYREIRREKDRIEQRLEALMRSERSACDADQIVGESRAVRQVRALIERVSDSERTTVLIEGESGTGKELVARAVHDRSPRCEMPFITLNCTAVPDTLLESELFGHEKGAFTDARQTKLGIFELGKGGTLFLDEIGDMSLSAQAKILRALEERSVRRVSRSRTSSRDDNIWDCSSCCRRRSRKASARCSRSDRARFSCCTYNRPAPNPPTSTSNTPASGISKRRWTGLAEFLASDCTVCAPLLTICSSPARQGPRDRGPAPECPCR